jgi:hypothetical protein
MMEYILVQDNDCHWFVIPAKKERLWSEWVAVDSEDERSWTPPGFAVEVGGSPSRVKFTVFRIEG